MVNRNTEFFQKQFKTWEKKLRNKGLSGGQNKKLRDADNDVTSGTIRRPGRFITRLMSIAQVPFWTGSESFERRATAELKKVGGGRDSCECWETSFAFPPVHLSGSVTRQREGGGVWGIMAERHDCSNNWAIFSAAPNPRILLLPPPSRKLRARIRPP